MNNNDNNNNNNNDEFPENKLIPQDKFVYYEATFCMTLAFIVAVASLIRLVYLDWLVILAFPGVMIVLLSVMDVVIESFQRWQRRSCNVHVEGTVIDYNDKIDTTTDKHAPTQSFFLLVQYDIPIYNNDNNDDPTTNNQTIMMTRVQKSFQVDPGTYYNYHVPQQGLSNNNENDFESDDGTTATTINDEETQREDDATQQDNEEEEEEEETKKPLNISVLFDKRDNKRREPLISFISSTDSSMMVSPLSCHEIGSKIIWRTFPCNIFGIIFAAALCLREDGRYDDNDYHIVLSIEYSAICHVISVIILLLSRGFAMGYVENRSFVSLEIITAEEDNNIDKENTNEENIAEPEINKNLSSNNK